MGRFEIVKCGMRRPPEDVGGRSKFRKGGNNQILSMIKYGTIKNLELGEMAKILLNLQTFSPSEPLI